MAEVVMAEMVMAEMVMAEVRMEERKPLRPLFWHDPFSLPPWQWSSSGLPP